MTPKEKAKELVDKYKPMLTQYGVSDNFAKEDAKQCALIAVDLVIKEANNNTSTIRYKGCILSDKEYWQQVKKEIENYK